MTAFVITRRWYSVVTADCYTNHEQYEIMNASLPNMCGQHGHVEYIGVLNVHTQFSFAGWGQCNAYGLWSTVIVHLKISNCAASMTLYTNGTELDCSCSMCNCACV